MILIVIPFWSENAEQAETLIDWIYQLNGNQASGSVLLVVENEVHAEDREKIKVSAELAFETVEMIQLPKFTGVKNEQINFIFKTVSEYIHKCFKCPFFWMEPDTTPVSADWFQKLSLAYEHQPKKYAGSFMSAGEKIFSGRVICYPPSAFSDLGNFCTGSLASFNIVAGSSLTTRATNHRLVQELEVNEVADCDKVKSATIAVHGDKKQILLHKLKDKK